MYLLYYFEYNDNDEPILQVLGIFLTRRRADKKINQLTEPYLKWHQEQSEIQERNRKRYYAFFEKHQDAIRGTEWGDGDVKAVIRLFSLNIYMRFWEESRYIDMTKISEPLPEIEPWTSLYHGDGYMPGTLKIKKI